ncbi:hypothetical protein SAMN05216238_101343 [Lentibacillus persicus]|uniref:Uncharacterized protein n=1 Tax=Lentibacillus persicus TaxID=640948 RepID=A0A1I1SBQ7_9BACI|nr:hypothetical protein [Lentibacillus persicus]SFD43929.1 hypothetical protein SAMN05216238_101343 [Lentibacillus persicus]
MKHINSPEELYAELEKLNKSNSASTFSVPGKGKFTLVYEDNEKTIQQEVEEDPELREMILESRKNYKKGEYKTTDELIDSLYDRKYKK